MQKGDGPIINGIKDGESGKLGREGVMADGVKGFGVKGFLGFGFVKGFWRLGI